VDQERVAIELKAQRIPAQIDTAIPCGLVLTELVSNIFKHAFPDGKPGRIQIRLFRSQDGKINLEVRDNGTGVPPGFNFRNQRSLGLQTVFALVENQLDGEVDFSHEQGVECRICFAEPHHYERK
jgi:two-component sensor histidine kinase